MIRSGDGNTVYPLAMRATALLAYCPAITPIVI